ncbi:MAG: hypothetical protein AAF993_23100 [Pseudomonadota bacterium]
MQRKTVKKLTRLVLLLFCVNATSAYGTCCYAAPDDLNSPKAQVLPPCHQSESLPEEAGADPHSGSHTISGHSDGGEIERCCLVCVSMVCPQVHAVGISAQQHSMALPVAPHVPHSGIDPPFRPPTDFLS